MNLRDEIEDELENYIQSDYSVQPCLNNILKLFEKRIDAIKQQEIRYMTGNDNGTEEMADTVNDIQSECYWSGAKNIINQVKELLK